MDLQQKKITRIIRLLSKKEVKQFILYLKSPFFVKPDHQPGLLQLFELLIGKKIKAQDENELFALLFPDEIFIKGRIDKLFSQLTKLLHNFLGIQEIQKSENIALATAKVLRERQELGLWKGYFSKIRKQILAKDVPMLEQIFGLLQLDLEEFHYSNLNPRKTSAQDYAKIINSLDTFYAFNMLVIGTQILGYNKFRLPEELENRFEHLNLFFPENSSTYTSQNQYILKKLFQLLRKQETVAKNNIQELLEFTESIKSELDHKIFLRTRSIARNFAIHLYNIGQQELEPFILSLYIEDEKNGAIFHEGKIQSSIVNNISTFALRQKKFKWLDEFLDRNNSKILESHLQAFIIALNKSKLLFFSGQYEEVKEQLNFDVTDFHLKTMARILEVMTYYELGSDQLPFKVEAFKVFVFRIPKKKIFQRFIMAHNNFVDILKSIIHPKTLHDKNRIEKLKNRIIETEVLAEKKWLLEKINQLH